MVLLTGVIHPINTTEHPAVPPGWRWAIMIGPFRADDMTSCVNAGWAPTVAIAEAEAGQNLATLVRALKVLAIPVDVTTQHLAHDPVPAGQDRINLA